MPKQAETVNNDLNMLIKITRMTEQLKAKLLQNNAELSDYNELVVKLIAEIKKERDMTDSLINDIETFEKLQNIREPINIIIDNLHKKAITDLSYYTK